MDNFSFHRPTEFIFGKDSELYAGKMVKKYGGSKVLIHYGGGSIVKSGLLQRVESSLKDSDIDYILLGGAKPNPLDTLVYEGIDICKKENINFILAVGGGSAIDSAKAIAIGALYDGDFWDFFDYKVEVKEALKVATILTIPAAGSEASASTVITKSDKLYKRAAFSPLMIPIFSLLNPELNYTLPTYQTACGISDMMAHIMERYFTNSKNVDISDRLCEAILLTIIEKAPIAIKEPTNYDARANLTWAGTIAHDGTCGVGREEDWATHMLEHELSALYDVAHGAGLSVMFPAWMKYVYETDVDRFVQFATRVWGIKETEDKKEVALKGIKALEDFYITLGLPINFKELGAKQEDIGKLVEVLAINSGGKIGAFKVLNMDDATKIYELACK